jgi:hypothetical protein
MGTDNISSGLIGKYTSKQPSGSMNFVGLGQVMEGIYPTFDSRENQYQKKGRVVENWYKQKPYAFKFTDRNGMQSTFYLPISPYNINITTHFATSVISTMYGTIEEHSEQRYYDIVISGTTGMSPRFYDVVQRQDLYDSKRPLDSIGRASFPVKSLVNGNLGGFFKRTQALVENTLNQASDLIGDDNGSTGIDLSKTGYVAFHNFYKFLLAYKKDVSGELGIPSSDRNQQHPLVFVNYKDNNQYNVAIQTFQLTRDASEPLLYNYNITMRAYNLQEADPQQISPDLADRAQELGLTKVENSSLFSKIAGKARKAKNAAYSVIAAAKGFGS